MIPEAVIDAAVDRWMRDHDGGETSDGVRMAVRERMKDALDLVMPHMMAQAWFEGRNSYPDALARNPYWTAK